MRWNPISMARDFLANLAKARQATAATPKDAFNEATDKKINTQLVADGIPLPTGSPQLGQKAKKAKKKKIERPVPRTLRRERVSIENHALRNRACGCGSNKKFKKCCLIKKRQAAWQMRLRLAKAA